MSPGAGPDWRPSAALAGLRARADLLADVRGFFHARGLLEVETPLLCSAGVTDPALAPLCVERGLSIAGVRYLQTSPEYAMKRLLAAGSGSIYQICKAFRDGEAGSRHNPEFTILEWYRTGFDHHQMMAEVAEFHECILGIQDWQKLSYGQLFQRYLHVDPHRAEVDELAALARSRLDVGDLQGDRDCWLELLLSHVIEPRLREIPLLFVYDYPASQAALARIGKGPGYELGHRFECYVHGLEMGNGFWELANAEEQRRRFEKDNELRRQRGQPELPLDECLLAALDHGLPACSGIAIGFDRLLMARLGKSDIRELLSFAWERS